MTTEVKVKVPAGANWRARVKQIDVYNDTIGGNVQYVEPGQEGVFYGTDTRTILVGEVALAPATV